MQTRIDETARVRLGGMRNRVYESGAEARSSAAERQQGKDRRDGKSKRIGEKTRNDAMYKYA